MKKLLLGLLSTVVSLSAVAQEVRYARVISVTPLESRSVVPETRQHCRKVMVPIYNSYHVQDNQNGLSPALGMLIGAAIGNQAFRGDARLAGTFLGAAVGHGVASSDRQSTYRNEFVGYQERVDCSESRQEWVPRVTITGYQVSYSIDGQIRTTVLNSYPGEYVRIVTSTSYRVEP